MYVGGIWWWKKRYAKGEILGKNIVWIVTAWKTLCGALFLSLSLAVRIIIALCLSALPPSAPGNVCSCACIGSNPRMCVYVCVSVWEDVGKGHKVRIRKRMSNGKQNASAQSFPVLPVGKCKKHLLYVWQSASDGSHFLPIKRETLNWGTPFQAGFLYSISLQEFVARIWWWYCFFFCCQTRTASCTHPGGGWKWKTKGQ